jgi:cell division protein FtsI (penicillin-binding protein 3)
VQIRKHALRFSLVFLTLIICLGVFASKLIFIQVFNSSHLANLAEKQHNHLIEIEPVRGAIFDRNLRPMAFNVAVYSLYANPRRMSEENKARVVREISVLLELDPNFVRKRLSRDKFFVWIKRKLDFEVMEEIESLKIRGLGFKKESKRFYPNQHLASHVIGFSGIDNHGLEGLELKYDDILRGTPGRMQIIRDARHRELMIEEDIVVPKNGVHLVLSIDETIQFIAERALEKTFIKYKANSATAIVMDVKTGEILALVNRPTYDLDNVRKSSIESRTNRAISFVYEPGSVFKVIAAAAALEEEAFNEDDIIFCENGEYRVANHILHDHKPHGNLTFTEVFRYSSNIGTTKIAQKLGERTFYKYAKRFPIGRLTGIDLKGEVSGLLKKPSTWSRTTIGALPIGHEVTTTPLQLVSMIATIANDGVLMKPYVVKYIKDEHDEVIESFKPEIIDRVISSNVAKRVTAILTDVVDEGTGRLAQINGVRVAGKTGTAQKVINGRYSNSNFVATFVGFAPADNPRLAIAVVVDDPQPIYYGGTVAGPVVKEILENSLKYLRVQGGQE